MVKNILILNMTRMGDLVQSTPAIAGLRKEYPNASITLVVSSLFDEFSKKIPFINKRVVFDIKQLENREVKNKILWIDIYQYLENFFEQNVMIKLSNLKI